MANSPYGVAKFSEHTSTIASDFGLALAIRKGFTESQIETVLGRYTRGKNKGKLRGYLVWYRIDSAGWCRLLGNGFVFPYTKGTFGYHIVNYDGDILLSQFGIPPKDRSDCNSTLKYALLVYLDQKREEII